MRPNAAQLSMLTGADRKESQATEKSSLLDTDLFNKATERSNERIETFIEELAKEIGSSVSGSGKGKDRR
jgi:hypothetical protein